MNALCTDMRGGSGLDYFESCACVWLPWEVPVSQTIGNYPSQCTEILSASVQFTDKAAFPSYFHMKPSLGHTEAIENSRGVR